jgi:ribose 5-phosphate isomerase B
METETTTFAVRAVWTASWARERFPASSAARTTTCGNAATAEGARRSNDANVLALSLRSTSAAPWFAGEPSREADDVANVEHLGEIDT